MSLRKRCNRRIPSQGKGALRGSLTALLKNRNQGGPSTSIHKLNAVRRVMGGSHAGQEFLFVLGGDKPLVPCNICVTLQ